MHGGSGFTPFMLCTFFLLLLYQGVSVTCSNNCIYPEWFGKASADLYFSCMLMVALQLLDVVLAEMLNFSAVVAFVPLCLLRPFIEPWNDSKS